MMIHLDCQLVGIENCPMCLCRHFQWRTFMVEMPAWTFRNAEPGGKPDLHTQERRTVCTDTGFFAHFFPPGDGTLWCFYPFMMGWNAWNDEPKEFTFSVVWVRYLFTSMKESDRFRTLAPELWPFAVRKEAYESESLPNVNTGSLETFGKINKRGTKMQQSNVNIFLNVRLKK